MSSALLMLAMTIHNFPEGLAVGVGVGALDAGAATALAIGIGLQNIPEGLAIALPLRRGGMGRGRAFFWGQLSAAIEPVAGVLGAGIVVASSAFLPYGMAAAADAMLYVVVEELMPETVRSETVDVATLGFVRVHGDDDARQRAGMIDRRSIGAGARSAGHFPQAPGTISDSS